MYGEEKVDLATTSEKDKDGELRQGDRGERVGEPNQREGQGIRI